MIIVLAVVKDKKQLMVGGVGGRRIGCAQYPCIGIRDAPELGNCISARYMSGNGWHWTSAW